MNPRMYFCTKFVTYSVALNSYLHLEMKYGN